jgi:hypothetical protein
MYNRKSTTSEFVSKAANMHGDRYDYSKVQYKEAGYNMIEMWESDFKQLTKGMK